MDVFYGKYSRFIFVPSEIRRTVILSQRERVTNMTKCIYLNIQVHSFVCTVIHLKAM